MAEPISYKDARKAAIQAMINAGHDGDIPLAADVIEALCKPGEDLIQEVKDVIQEAFSAERSEREVRMFSLNQAAFVVGNTEGYRNPMEAALDMAKEFEAYIQGGK